MKKGCILQPSYLPWLGFFAQFASADIFVFLDDVQYTKQDWRNRNKIRTYSHSPDGWQWLSVPVQHRGHTQKIRDVRIDYGKSWPKKHLNLITQNYNRAKFFHEFFPILETLLDKKYKFLTDLNIYLILAIADYLGIQRKTVRSSELQIEETDKNLRLVNICQKTGIKYFYDGKSAQNFIDRSLFDNHDIIISFQNYSHPSYRQTVPPFISHLSIIDLLFHEGRKSLEIVLTGESTRQ